MARGRKLTDDERRERAAANVAARSAWRAKPTPTHAHQEGGRVRASLSTKMVDLDEEVIAKLGAVLALRRARYSYDQIARAVGAHRASVNRWAQIPGKLAGWLEAIESAAASVDVGAVTRGEAPRGGGPRGENAETDPVRRGST